MVFSKLVIEDAIANIESADVEGWKSKFEATECRPANISKFRNC